MKFKDALKKVEKIAKGNFFSLKYELVHFKEGTIKAECSVYMAGYTFYSGKTWEEAITKLQEAINPTPVKLDGMPEEDVKEVKS